MLKPDINKQFDTFPFALRQFCGVKKLPYNTSNKSSPIYNNFSHNPKQSPVVSQAVLSSINITCRRK